MRLIWTGPAQCDLRQIREYISKDNPAAAIRIGDRIIHAASVLRQSPYQGRPGRVDKTRELVIAGVPYIAIYEIRSNAIEILRIMHQAQQWPPTVN